ncbi:MAG: Translation factor guf1 mitochondrial, partial [Chrysothrix sp. TS-e1954]
PAIPKWQQNRKATSLTKTETDLENRIAAIPISRFRNFCIIAHIDHGKSTLSDRLLELTGVILRGGVKQSLDTLRVERERGITVKAQTCCMIYKHKGQDYLLHLVDTPGHVDFRAEVSRSFASCGGALLLIDASQGIQAQTVANYFQAFAQGLQLVPVINKIDLPSADINRTLEQIKSTFELDASDTMGVSAKTGLNVEKLLPTIIERVPAPIGSDKDPLQILLVDSWYDPYRGVILLVRLFSGTLKPGDALTSFATSTRYTVIGCGILYPSKLRQNSLRAGQVGYIYFNPAMKQMSEAKVGDTFTHTQSFRTGEVQALPGFEEPRPMVFVSAFPIERDDFQRLDDSIQSLMLNDRAITVHKTASEALGAGFTLGFLGTLHCSVFQDRLSQEYGTSVILTPPAVPYKVIYTSGKEEILSSPLDFPDAQTIHTKILSLQEPFVAATVTLPEEYLGRALELCEGSRGIQKDLTFFTASQVVLKYDIPLSMLVEDFFGRLKSATKGYASLDYEDAGWRPAKLERLQLMVNKVGVDAISRVVHTTQAERLAREWVGKFKEHVERQLFEVVIQAGVGGGNDTAVGRKILARETVPAFRKDVTAKLHAADTGRKQKLLNKQKEGRKRMRAIGKVEVKQEAFQGFLAKS